MNRIRDARKAKGLTAKWLASELGVSESTVSQYENCKREPDHATLVRIANILNVSLDYLLCRSEDSEETKKQPIAQGDELNPRVRDLIIRLNEQNTEKILDYAELLLTSQEK